MESIRAIIAGLGNWAEVRVRWCDAYAPHSGWHEVSNYEPKDSVATTTGRIWQNCQEGYLTLVGTVFEAEAPDYETVGDINHVPLGMILDVELIRKAAE